MQCEICGLPYMAGLNFKYIETAKGKVFACPKCRNKHKENKEAK